MNGLLARMTVLGIVGVAVVAAVIFVAVFGFIYRPDHDLTNQAVGALLLGSGGVLAAAARFFGGGEDVGGGEGGDAAGPGG